MDVSVNTYMSQGDYREGINYHERHSKIAKEIDDPGGEAAANGNLGSAYGSLGDYLKAIEVFEKL